MAVPVRNSLLVNYATTFASIVSLSPTTYGTTAAAAAQLTSAVSAFSLAYAAQQADGAKSRTLTAAMKSAAKLVVILLRPMYAAIAASTMVSDAH